MVLIGWRDAFAALGSHTQCLVDSAWKRAAYPIMVFLAQHSKEVRNSDAGYFYLGCGTVQHMPSVCVPVVPRRHLLLWVTPFRSACRAMPEVKTPKGMSKAEFTRLKLHCYQMVWRHILREMLEFAQSGQCLGEVHDPATCRFVDPRSVAVCVQVFAFICLASVHGRSTLSLD